MRTGTRGHNELIITRSSVYEEKVSLPVKNSRTAHPPGGRAFIRASPRPSNTCNAL